MTLRPLVVILLAWLGLTLSGFVALERYANTPAAAAVAPVVRPADWPSGAPFAQTPGLATIVLLAHPRCPCTKATLHELARVMTRVDGRAEAWVYFANPGGGDASWEDSDLWEIARGIPGVHAVADPQGQTAALLGARTSGQVVAYGADGRLVFTGGITGSRGHEGDNDGHSLLVAGILDPSAPTVASVFGCAIFGAESP